MKAGDKVVCVDDKGWLLPDPTDPVKGEVYCLTGYTPAWDGARVQLAGKGDRKYFARRFRPVAEVGHPPVAIQKPEALPA